MNTLWEAFLKKLAPFSSDLFRFFISWIAVDAILRIWESIKILNTQSLPEDWAYTVLSGYVKSIAFNLSVFIIYIFPIFVIAYIILKTHWRIIFRILGFIYISAYILLIEYFIATQRLLDEVLFYYAFDELVLIIRNSSAADYHILILAILVILLVSYLSSRAIKQLQVTNTIVLVFLSLAVLCSVFRHELKLRPNEYTEKTNYSLSVNKALNFIDVCIQYLKSDSYTMNEAERIKNTIKLHENYPGEYFRNIDFPFLRVNNSSNPLGELFELQDSLPNIVFIIGESLGKDISGKDAYNGSFTPFLDSLAKHSLYFPNFLSNAERTFGALPNILGSLPFGPNGFLQDIDSMPKHHSILSILNKNGYNSFFFYGGWSHFDKMDSFFKANGTNNFITYFGPHHTKIAPDSRNFSWGYNDWSLFNRSFELIDSLKIKAPRLDVYLTLNIHSYWKAGDTEYYKALAQKKIDQLQLEHIKEAENYLLKYACVLSTDDAIRNYFNQAKKESWFENTIYIILGDHGLQDLPTKNELSAYNIPLIIYSPLLKESRRIESISSQHDIAQSILALLQHQYNIEMPKNVAWLGKGIDTARVFRSDKTIAFIKSNRKVTQMISGDYFLSDGNLFRLSKGLHLKKINDEALKNSLTGKLETYIMVDKYTYTNNRIIE